MKRYREIEMLEKFIQINGINISPIIVTNTVNRLVLYNLTINNKSLEVYITDEFDDLKIGKKTLNVFLILRELAIIDDSEDFLQWCRWNDLNANNTELLAYYKDISKELPTLKSYFDNNEIDYFISDLDFQLNSGAMQFLRRSQFP